MKKLFIAFSLLIVWSCSYVVHDEIPEQMPDVNLDSLFSIGDSVLANLYMEQAQQKLNQAEQQMNMDSLNSSLSDYKGKLTNREKVESEIRNRIIYKDTIVYRQEVQTIYTTIRDTLYVTDTIRDTVRVKRKNRKGK